jgi:hypothetical protein
MVLNKYLMVISISVLGFQIAIAQPFKSVMELNIGKAFHGTGDLPGFIVDFSHVYRPSKHFGLVSSLATTIHYSSHIYSLYDRNPDFYTTAGFQLSTSLRLSFDLAKAHELHLAVGPMIRFQANSQPNLSSVTYNPSSTNISHRYLFEFDPQTSISPGYIHNSRIHGHHKIQSTNGNQDIFSE